MYSFCTYFDRNYLTRGLALYTSLVQHCKQPFRLWVLCFDDETYDILSRLALPNVCLISYQEFEATNARLLQVKGERTLVEYYWTCTPVLPLYILEQNSQVDLITYLDADLYFFSDPQPIYDEFGNGSILIIEHRFPPGMGYLEVNGIFNVGWISFRRDAAGLSALSWWAERCIEWCYARHELGKFGDQKYLDDWTTRFPDVVVLQHKGAGLAPWNITGYSIVKRDVQLWVDNEKLIFYHFHGMKQSSSWLYQPVSGGYQIAANHKRWLYEPYIVALNQATWKIKRVMRNFQTPTYNLPFSKLRAVMEKKFDVIGGTNYLPVLRQVYATIQAW